MKMMDHMKRLLPLASFIMGSFGILLFLIYLGFATEATRNATLDTGHGIRFVLVNEDLGGTFNGFNYHLGAEFVSLVNQDMENDWQTASRGVAEAGLRSEIFDVMVILPQNFTERLLALESFNPEAAQIEYAIRLGQNDITNALVHEQVSQVLDGFNQRIVQMYFSSILGSLFDAQLNVSEMVSDEESRHDTFIEGIEAPFSDIPSRFSIAVSSANALDSANESWRTNQNSFREQTGAMLTRIADDVNTQSSNLGAHMGLGQTLAQANHRNTQFSLGQQSNADGVFYRTQFTGLNQRFQGQMALLYVECDESDTTCDNDTVLGRLRTEADGFYTNQNALRNDFGDQIDTLESQVDDHVIELRDQADEVLNLRSSVAGIFLGDADLSDLDAINDEAIRVVILELLDLDAIPDNSLDHVYLEVVDDYIERMDLDALPDMIEMLYDYDLIDSDQRLTYLRRIAIVERFVGVDIEEEVITLDLELDDDPDEVEPDESILDYLGDILAQLSYLEGASRQIITLFGGSNANSQTVHGFYQDIGNQDTIREDAPADSVYRRHDTFMNNELEEWIVGELIQIFRDQGIWLFGELTERHGELVAETNALENQADEQVEAFDQLRNRLPVARTMLGEFDHLHTWQENAREAVEETYETWNQASVLQMTLRRHNSDSNTDEESLTIFYDVNSGASILAQADAVSGSAQGDAQSIANQSTEIDSLSPQFASLLEQTEGVAATVDQIQSNLGLLSIQFSDEVEANTLFSEAFSQVMENARIGGIDNPDVLSFLSSPINLTGHVEGGEEASLIPFYFTVILSVLALAVGYGFRYFKFKQPSNTRDHLIGLSRVIQNKDYVFMVSLISLTIGSFLGFMSRTSAGQAPLIWMAWVTMLVMSGVLFVSYLARVIPKVTLFIVAFFLAIYLLLTPALGTQVEPRTFVALLFRFSPLQWVEDMISLLVSSGRIRAISHVIMLGVVILGILSNLYMRPTKQEGV